MDTALNLVTIIMAVTLILTILLQSSSSSFSGGFSGQSDSIQRTRRGFDKTLFQFTIGIAIFFVVMTILSSIIISS